MCPSEGKSLPLYSKQLKSNSFSVYRHALFQRGRQNGMTVTYLKMVVTVCVTSERAKL